MRQPHEPTEREIAFMAFGPHPEPECDGAGRDAYAEMMRERRRQRALLREEGQEGAEDEQ